MNPQAIINQLFSQYLGRMPTQAEMTGFTSALNSGVTDATGLALFLQGSSQFQQAQIPGQTQQYAQTLQAQNQNILNQGFDKAQQQFAQQGRQNSSGLGSAFAQVAGNLASQQAPQIANFQGQLQQNALNPNQYAGSYFGNQQNIQNQQFGAGQASLQNQWYQDALNRNMKQQNQNNWFGLGGSLLGGLAGGAGLGLGKGIASLF